nr:MAG TPA_asm: Large polyvalent protein associated domain 38 [Caudoviricetes sp.]
MPYNTSALSYLDNLAAMTQQAALDNEAARQQLALEQQQSQARIAEAQQAMEDALAQQQAAYVAQQQQAQLQAQQQQAAADTAAMSTGNKWADEFIASADKFNYGTHGIDPNGATLWNRKVLDNWLEAKAREENWNALQKDQIKKQVKDAVIKASTNKHLFDTEERGFWGAVGDIGNSLADSAVGGLADLASTLNIAAYEGAKRMEKAGYTDALGNINPVYALEKAWEFTGLGDGKLNWDKQIDDAVVATRAAWGDLKSDYSKDAARARAEASGVAETLLALGDKPTTAFDELASALGVVVGAKGLNLVGRGVATVGKGVVKGAAKATSKATFGLADDVLRAGGAQLGRAAGVLKPVAERLNPSLLARSAAIEGSGNAMNVLRQEGAYNADTAQYTDDALAIAAATGLLTGGVTYLGGRLFSTVEGTAARALGGRAAAGNTALSQTLLSGSGLTIEQALRTVADDIVSGAASKATRDVLGEATEFLMSRTAQLVPKTSNLSAAFSGAKQVTSGMLGEGLEEGLIGMISSAATQGLGKDGTFNTNNIDLKEVMRAGANAATLGATLGVVSGSFEAAGKYRENRANVDRILRDNEQADANLQEARQLWYDLENPAGVAQTAQQAQPTQPQAAVDPLQQAQAQAQQPNAPLALPSPNPTLAIPSNIDSRLPDDVYRELALQAYKERVAQADAARADRVAVAEADASKQRAMGDRLADYAKTEQAKTALNELLTPEQRAERATAGFRFADDILNRSDIHVPQGVRATIELLGQLERAQDLIKSGTLDKATEQSLLDSASQLLRYATRQGRLEAARTWVDKNLLNIKTAEQAKPAQPDGTTKAVSNIRSTKTVLENNGITGAASKDVMRLMKDVKSTNARVELNNFIEAFTSDEPTDVGYYRDRAVASLTDMYVKQGQDQATAEASAQQLVDDLEATLSDGVESRAATKEAASQEGAAAEAKKLQLTLFDEVTPDATQAVHDTARAMQKHGAPTAVQGDLFGDMDVRNQLDTEGRPTEWAMMSDAEKHFAIEQQTITRGTNALRNAFGDDIAWNVVWVSPRSQNLHNRNTRAYVVDGDPNTIYVVAHPHMTNQQFVYAVAHEMLHQGVDVNLRGKVLRGADYNQHMDRLAENPFVQALMARIGERYGNIDKQSMVEEALAEIHAARTTKDGWNTLRNEWGLDMDIPAALRSTNSSSLVSRIVSYLKQVVSRLTGKFRKASDSDVADFLKVVTARRPNDTAGIRTPDQVREYRQRMSFESAQARSDYYHDQARSIYPDFDSLDSNTKADILSQLATGDAQAQTELGLQVRNSLLPVNDPWKDPKWRAQQQAADHAQKVAVAQQAANQVPPASNPQAQADYVRRTVRQIRIYPSRANTSYYNAADLDTYVGIISQVRKGDEYFIRVEMNDDATGAKGIIYEEPVTGDIDLDMHKAWEALVQQYPNAHYERREGSTYSTEANRALTPEELVVLNRAQQMGLSSPSLRRWTNWLREKLPANYVPILDKFLDIVEMARTHWVSIYTPFIAVEQMYADATGKQTNIITRLLRDKSEAGAFLHRNFNSTNPNQQSLRDRTERLRQTIIDSGLSQDKVNRILHGLEERVRSDVLLNSDESLGHWQEVNGNRVLFDPATGRPRYTVTGYRLQDLDTTDPNAGTYDLRGIRLAQALANLTVEERNKIGSIVAEVAETNRIVNKLKHERGVLTDKDYYERIHRGKDYLDLVFPELAAQGVDFGGFFVTMRDDDSSAYSKAHALGRASAVENVLGNTAKVWEAEVKTAFTNNELSQFALMVMSMPNKHFVIDPVSPRNNFDDPDNVLDWETSHKGEQDSIMIYINGTPVRLVAKSKAAAKALRQEQPHAAVAKIGSINHYFNQFKTSLNPAYPVFGLMRDIMTGYLNISGAIGEQYVDGKSAPAVGMKSIGYALKYLFSPDKHNLFLGTARGQYTDSWQLAYQRLGAGMQFGDNLNTDAFATNPLTGRLPQQADLLRTGVSKARGITARVAETIAYPPETAMRLGVFRAYVEHVFGPQPSNVTAEQLVDLFDQAKNPVNADKAAAIILGTKNLTSNFQQHGADNMVRHMFSFHNAVMQGTFSTLPQILSTKHGRNSMALMGIGLLMAAVANVGGEDDDEFGNSKYYQIANRNRTVKLGDVQIPIPDEMGWFKLLIDNAVGVAMGKRNIIDAATEQAGGMVDMTTAQHWGNTDNAVANAMFFAAPAFAQPAVALTTGKDIFGRELKSEYAYDENGKRIQFAADVERTTYRASSIGTDIAEMLYGATGGAVDMTGDEIDVLGQGYLGGLYRSVTRGIDASADRDMGIADIVGSELFRSTKPIHIDGQSEEAWLQMGEKLHVSTRHAGGTLDILNADIDPSVTEAQRIYSEADKKMRAAKSDMGYSYKQLNDMIRQAEAEGRYQDVRDYRADMRTIRTNKAAIRAEAFTELNLLGIK